MATKTKKHTKQNQPLIIILCIIIVLGIIGLFFLEKHTIPNYAPTLAETYAGDLPCADCSGLRTTMLFTKSPDNNQEGTYVLNELYEGKTTIPIVTTGKWNISRGTPSDPQAFVLTLTHTNASENTYYLVEGGAKLTLLDQKKEKINSPFNESLNAASTMSAVHLSETATKMVSQLPSWVPDTNWSEPLAYQQQTFYGNFDGSEVTGLLTTKEASVPHFENASFLQSLGFAPDTNLSADGPGSSTWGYAKETNGKKQIVLFSYQTRPSSFNPNEPLQFNCPCKVNLAVFISN